MLYKQHCDCGSRSTMVPPGLPGYFQGIIPYTVSSKYIAKLSAIQEIGCKSAVTTALIIISLAVQDTSDS